MNIETQILSPVVVLICWSMIMWIWMYATRIPAMMAARLKPDPSAPSGEQMATLPASVRWKADNYNHLMEQPTIFYALAITLAIFGEGSGINFYLACVYVGLRVIHSLVQAITNKIELRFSIFVLSNVALFWLTINAVIFMIQS
ncbi:MAG: MAPEG family protein [Cellvibrionaceae bacterium]